MAASGDEEVVGWLRAFSRPSSQQMLHEADRLIRQAKTQHGFAVVLMRISLSSDKYDIAVSQLAAIVLKQVVEASWDEDAKFVIAEGDKDVLRQGALQGMMTGTDEARRQYKEVVKVIVEEDWPARWGDLVPRLGEVIKSESNPRLLEGALLVLYQVMRKYENADKKGREMKNQLVVETFPVLLSFLGHLSGMSSAEASAVQKAVLKIFYSAVRYRLPPMLRDENILAPWLQRMVEIVRAPLPAGEPVDADLRKEWAPWKVKKWCFSIFYKIFQTYGDPVHAKKNKAKRKWARGFAKTYGVSLTQVALEVASGVQQGRYIPEMVSNKVLLYLGVAVRHSSTWAVLAPHAGDLIKSVLFPVAALSEDEHDLWETDPDEFIRVNYDILGEYYRLKSHAVQLISTLVELRSEVAFQPCLDLVIGTFNEQRARPDDEAVCRRFEGAMHVFGCLQEYFENNGDTFLDMVQRTIAEYIMPQFTSPRGYLAARATHVFAMYTELLTDRELVMAGVRGVLDNLSNTDAVAKMQSALAIRQLVEIPEAEETFRSILPKLFEVFFSFLQEVDNDDIVSSLETVIYKFRYEIAPFAVNICTFLTHNISRTLQMAEQQDGDEAHKYYLTAAECGRTIVTVLMGIRKTPQVYVPVTNVLLPYLRFALAQEGNYDMFENCLKCLSFITYCLPTTPYPDEIWQLLPVIVDAYYEWAADYFSEIYPVLDNLASRDPQSLVTKGTNGKSYLEIMWRIVGYLISGKSSDPDALEALRLVEILLQCCRGGIDHLVPEIIDRALYHFSTADAEDLVCFSLVTFLNALFYNPLITLKYTEEKDVTARVFERLLSVIAEDKLIVEVTDRKMVVLGLGALLQVPVNHLPASLQAALPVIVRAQIATLRRMQEAALVRAAAKEKRAAAKEAAGGTAPSYEGLSFIGKHGIVDDEDEIDDDANDPYIDDDEEDDAEDDKLYRLAKRIQEINGGEFAFDDDDDLDLYEEDDDHEDEVFDDENPVNKLNEVVYFVGQLQAAMEREPGPYQQVIGSIEEDATYLPELQQRAHVIQQEEAAKAAAKANQSSGSSHC